ncbi:LCP family protein [Actinokineospora iranica]|uniref:Cell envelope-related function transcriptional attenuator common domain-containing protein n=1 Tax=Actinokineospora iranica TaxID=1271860 RepID=A0A1G6J6D2_9PSEU|nr:LCP family protein [Actinokineospora iranica]SDC14227.1 cell envelope-related function transcriptional attenuator common domain-containing protein [Actinokineospora iranica]
MSYGHNPGSPGYRPTRRMERPQVAQRQQRYDPRRPPPPPPGRGPGGPPPRGFGQRPPRRKKRFGRIALIVALVIVALVAGLWIYLESSLKRVAALGDYEGRPAAGAGANWLIVGSDSRADLSAEDEERLATGDAKGQRTDTIMLMHIPDNSTKPTLVSLLRDSYVDIPGKGKNKLNAAYAFGGSQLLAKTVELNTGLRLDHYVEIGFGGFADVVDAVGGVDMCLANPIDDPLAGINLPAGCQELDGASALGYVRTRKGPRADLDRVIRQREFIGALTDKATNPGTLLNPFRLFPLLSAAPDAVTVDEDDHLHNLPSLAFAMGAAGDGGLTTTTVPMGGSKSVRGVGSVILWDAAKSKKLFEALRTDAEVPADVIVGPPA